MGKGCKHTLVYTSGGGRTCDQLLTLAQFVAFCAEYPSEFEVVDMPFWPYGKGFNQFSTKRICSVSHPQGVKSLQPLLSIIEFSTRLANGSDRMLVPRNVGRIRKGLIRCYELAMVESRRSSIWIGEPNSKRYHYLRKARRRDILELNDPQILEDLRSRPTTLLAGPKIRCWDLVKRHAKVVRETLALCPQHRQRGQDLIAELRKRYDFIVAVHIRQTDYRGYNNGRFYYPTEQYVAWTKQLHSLLLEKGRVCYVIVSDQPQSETAFAGLPHFFAPATQGAGHFLEDLATLSLCDLVLATASSFAFWGAFKGGVPVLPVTKQNQEVKLDDLVHNIWDCPNHPDLRIPIW